MDTPERNQIGSSVSKYEDSPVFNYLSNLSPIKPVKSAPVTQTFTSLNFNSIPSVFTSPHAISRKESRFLRRHNSNTPDKTQSDVSYIVASDDNKENEVFVDVNQLHSFSSELHKESSSLDSLGKAPPESLNEETNLPMQFCQNLNYDCGFPGSDSKIHQSAGEDASQSAEATTSSVMFEFEQSPSTNILAINERPNGWESLVSERADLLMFDSPSIPKDLDALFKSHHFEHVDPSLGSQFPQDTPDFLKSDSTFLVDVCELQNESEHFETEGIICGLDDHPNTMTEFVACHPTENANVEPMTSLHRGVKRRCLTFETKRANSKYILGAYSSNPPRNRESNNTSSLSVLPGIGLHLNALHQACVSGSATSFHSPTTARESLHNVLMGPSLEKNVDSDIVQGSDASLELDLVSLDDFNQNSSTKKRHKQENPEDESCKRCNCKKSKCLKLYCECFAAGVYCTGTCACQGCMNKLVHKETVVETRKQIESRNPLAFAPKVIRTSDSLPDAKDEVMSTPASARHKRGCNCKKSGCQKKYCECYQGGVGCSINCRCEGCKNVFGTKDGKGLAPVAQQDDEYYEEEAEKVRTKINHKRPQKIMAHNNEEHYANTFPETPQHLTRIPAQLPFSSKGKPPRSSLFANGSTSKLQIGKPNHFDPPLKIQKNHLVGEDDTEMPNILRNGGSPDSSIKTSSPNSKRISSPNSNLGSSSGRRSTRKLILQSIPSFPSLTQS